MSFQSKWIRCLDCGTTFTFSVGEQEFFQSKGYTNEPKRCPECRNARKSNCRGNTNYGHTYHRQMFPAACSDCGKATEVPFEPREGRPVYCRDCNTKVRLSR